MKKLLTSLLLLISTIGMSQSRIGYTAKEIIQEFNNHKIESEYSSNGDLILIVQIGDLCEVLYMFFDKSETCSAVAIMPKSNFATNYFVEKYNKEYVILSNKAWRMYYNNMIINIRMQKSDGNLPYFEFIKAAE